MAFQQIDEVSDDFELSQCKNNFGVFAQEIPQLLTISFMLEFNVCLKAFKVYILCKKTFHILFISTS